MLPQELMKLLSEVVSNQKGNYIRERNKDLEQLTYKMANQGLGKSSAFEKKKAEIYCQSVGKFAQAVWHDMQRVLEHGFDYYPGCEDDLIKFLEKSLADTFEWDANSLSKLNRFGPSQQMPYGLFDWHCKDATKKVLIEFKIFIRKFKPKPELQKTNVSDMPVIASCQDNNLVQSITKEAFLDLVKKIPVVGESLHNVINSKGGIKEKVWAIILILVVGIILFAYKERTKVSSSSNNPPPTVSQSANNSPGAIQAGRDTTMQGIGNSNTISDSVVAVGSGINVTVDKSQKYFYGDTNQPLFKLYVNDPEQETTNGSKILLSESREIQLFVKNVSKTTVSGMIVDFNPDMVGDATTNLITDHWYYQGNGLAIYHFKNIDPNTSTGLPQFRFQVGSVPPNYEQKLPSIFISTNFIPPTIPSDNPNNFPFPALWANFRVYADGSEMREFNISFYLKEQRLPPKNTDDN